MKSALGGSTRATVTFRSSIGTHSPKTTEGIRMAAPTSKTSDLISLIKMAFLLILTALFSAVFCNELDDEAGVVVFNPESYKQARTYGEAWFVMFVAPDCPYSREWEEKWRFMANRWGPKS